MKKKKTIRKKKQILKIGQKIYCADTGKRGWFAGWSNNHNRPENRTGHHARMMVEGEIVYVVEGSVRVKGRLYRTPEGTIRA